MRYLLPVSREWRMDTWTRRVKRWFDRRLYIGS